MIRLEYNFYVSTSGEVGVKVIKFGVTGSELES